MPEPRKIRTLIMGAAGRDFHDFNVWWKQQPDIEVVCFTANQIPDIAGRVYPPVLAGPQYPRGIPIYPEDRLDDLIREFEVELVTFAYSDVQHETVMHAAARVNAAGAEFRLLGCRQTMLRSTKPVIAVGAVRTGCGKSQTSRRVTQILAGMGLKTAVVRHPMPYGDLTRQICQRFASVADMDAHQCTIEEREEYEPHVAMGNVVFAGVDYEKILRAAEAEADVVLWDGGNNDLPFYAPDLQITLVDPLRPGNEAAYHPGEANVRIADVAVIAKCDSATPEAIAQVTASVRALNPGARIIEAESPVTVEHPELVAGKRVVVIEDGPTLTHGSMSFGAGVVGARAAGASEIVDPSPYAVESIAATYVKYPNARGILPAMGYGEDQVGDLAATIAAVPCDAVVSGTPIDLTRVLRVDRPMTRARYELRERVPGQLKEALAEMLA